MGKACLLLPVGYGLCGNGRPPSGPSEARQLSGKCGLVFSDQDTHKIALTLMGHVYQLVPARPCLSIGFSTGCFESSASVNSSKRSESQHCNCSAVSLASLRNWMPARPVVARGS